MIICRPWITVHGKRIYAFERGLKAFCFEVNQEKPKKADPERPSSPDDTEPTVN